MLITLLFCLLWTLYYFLIVKWNSSRSAEWNSRIVSATHAIVATKMTETCFFVGPWPFDSMGETNTTIQTYTMHICAGYFIFEVIWCFVMRTEGVMMLLHHFISLVGLLSCLYLGKCGSDVTAVVWGSEITNPFLQIRWFLRETKQYYSPLAYINDLTFVFLFGLVRIVIGGFLAYFLLSSKGTPMFLKIGGYAFYAIGVIWMWQILKFARKRLYSSLDGNSLGKVNEHCKKNEVNGHANTDINSCCNGKGLSDATNDSNFKSKNKSE